MQFKFFRSINLQDKCCSLFAGASKVLVVLTILVIVDRPTNAGCIQDDSERPVDPGRNIYLMQCASCHGQQGQGTDQYPNSLQGKKTVAELQEYISQAMPEDEPDNCVGDHAREVAEFIYREFYSAIAQRKFPPPRVQLSRLTVRQYRQSVADLVNSFSKPHSYSTDRGLNADYFGSRNWTEYRRLAKQQDSNIDFADGVPYFDPTGKYEHLEPIQQENKMNDGFSVVWNGAILPPETGQYEFKIESKNGFGLWINDDRKELIDRWVRSDDENVHVARIFLLGGRAYPLQLKLFSYPDPPAKIRLSWTPPGGVSSVVPNSALLPQWVPASIAVSTTFPADDASAGYERGVSVSQQWDESTTKAAIESADWIASRIWKLAGTKNNAKNRIKKVKAFCKKFVQRAFIKPLSEYEIDFFVDQHFQNDLPVQEQVKRVVILTLKSPRFLYPAIGDRDINFEIARNAAMGIWDSVPDQELFQLAADGKLSEQEVLNRQLLRMVDDPRAKSKLRSFFHSWLQANGGTDVTKDQDRFPDFNEQLLADLRTSLDLYLEKVAWSEASDFRQLFLADYLIVNKRLAGFYGLESESVDFAKVDVDPDQRAGVLTHPFLMTVLAYHKDSSPIHRGVFVGRRLHGRQLRQPPEDVKPLTEEFDPTMTTRQRVEHQTKDAACMNCHSVINPLGFTLETFDAVGRLRSEEKHKAINVTTVYKTGDGKTVPLNGARELAIYLANDAMAQRNFIAQVFRYFVKQPVAAYGDDNLDRLHKKFIASDFSIRQLLIDIVLVACSPENLADRNQTDVTISGTDDEPKNE